MQPDVRYCTTTDGVRIAYTVTGEGPVYVSLIDAIASHVDYEWSHPASKRHLEAEARYFTLVRLDTRGSGLSQRTSAQSRDDLVRDVEAVVERLGLTQFTLHANTTSTATAVTFAARHPDLVSRLVIIDGYLRGADMGDAAPIAAIAAAAAIDWWTATEAIGAMVFGSGSEESRVHGQYIRSCIGPEYFEGAAIAYAEDVTELARSLSMPVLVVRHDGFRWISDEMTQDLVSTIPDARLITVPGTWVDDPEGLARRIAQFVYGSEPLPDIGGATSRAAEPARAAGNATGGETLVILFTDIVSSTALTERMGDAAFRAASRALDQDIRSAIRNNGGTAVDGKVLGDGVMGTFSSARQAIAAAMRCSSLSAASELALHIGLHAGDVIREDDNVYGGAVNVAARICAISDPGQVLVSDVVRGLARTSAGVDFEDLGEQAMKGVGEAVRLYRVRAS